MNKYVRILTLVVACLATFAGCKTDGQQPAPAVRPSMTRTQNRPARPAPVHAMNLPRLSTASPQPQLRGVNLVGAEMDWGTNNVTNPVSGTDYLFVSRQDIDYLVSRGVTFARLTFSWEGVQPSGLNTALATTGNNGTYVSTFIDRVNYATSKGMYVMIEPHGASSGNFARYKGSLVGTSGCTNAEFAYFWSLLADQFGSNPRVGFGLSNEPNNMSTVQWFQAAQAAILGIRNTGATNTIFVPGNGWTGAESWTSTWYDTASPQVSNATAWVQYIKDPGNNVVVSVHSYLDANAGGGGTDIVSPTIEVDRVSVTVNWARSLGLRVHVSEFGTTSSSAAQTAVNNWLVYEAANTDVLVGWAWWAYGPPAWWSGYQFTLDPTSNYTVDQPQMGWLKPYFVPASISDAGAADSGAADAGADSGSTDAGIADAGSDSGADAGSLMPFTVSAVKTYDWGTGYCKQFYFYNPNATARTWKTMTVYLKDGTLRGASSVWGAVFPNPTATGTIVVSPASYTSPVPAKTKLQTVGFCANYGPSKYVGTNGGLTY